MASIVARDALKVYQPYWSNGSNNPWLTTAAETALGAGVVFQTTIPHPYATIGEQYVEFKCNNADHSMLMTQGGAVGGALYDTTRRWGGVASFLLQLTATNPAADSILWHNDYTGAIIGTSTYRKLVWVAATKTVALYAGATPTLIATSTLSLPATTDVRVEVWEVWKNSSGTDLPANQFVVRYMPISTLVMTTLINATSGSFTGQAANTSNLCFGSKTADANDARFYIGNAFQSVQNADEPYGNIRVDRLDPTGSGHVTNWANTFTLVSEAGTGTPNSLPDTKVSTPGTGLSNVKQTYATANPTKAATGDTIITVQLSERVKYAGTLDKGATQSIATLLSDGTTDVTGNASTLTTTYQMTTSAYIDKPGGSGWAFADLAAVEVGQIGNSTTTGSAITLSQDTSTTLVAYVLSSDAAPTPVPAAPRGKIVEFTQAKNRAATF